MTTTLATLVARRRQDLHLSLRELGRRAGVSYAGISDIERGRVARPNPETLRGLAIGLDLPLSEIKKAADEQAAEQVEFRLPPRAKYLTVKQRRAVLAMVEALLDNQDEG